MEISYLMLTPYMSSELSKGELLLKITTLTNQIKGLDDTYIDEIKLFQLGILEKLKPKLKKRRLVK